MYKVLFLLIFILGLIRLNAMNTDDKSNLLEGVTRIVCVGNSLTAGAGGEGVTYPDELCKLLKIKVLNQGVGGQTSTQIAARIGAIPLYVTVKNNRISDADSIVITDKSVNVLYDSGHYIGNLKGSLCGVKGWITTDAKGNWFFHRDKKGNVVECPSGSVFIPENDYKETDFFIFWLGRNNYGDTETVLSDINACVQFVQRIGCKFLVLSVLNADVESEYRGRDGYKLLDILNKHIEREYPYNYVDVRTPLVNSYVSTLKKDKENYQNDVLPSSLRSDHIHLNASGYCLLAKIISDFLSYTPSNSFSAGYIWPDNNGTHINAHGGGVIKVLDTYYWFGEHKVEGEKGNLAQVGIHCYSSKDLYNWKDEGVALPVSKKENSPITQGCIMERPKVIYNEKTRKYVMWFHLEPKGKNYSGALSGVAISDKVAGPYQFVKSIRPNVKIWPINVLDIHKTRVVTADVMYGGGSLPQHPDSLNILARDYEKGQMARDMNLFVDDDGKAYHIYASEDNSTLHISQLSDDYLDEAGRFGRFFVGRFMEAPAMFKHNDKYYLIMSGCTGWLPNAGRCAVADSIWGPWKELDNPFKGNGSEVSFKSQSTYVLKNPNKKGEFIYMGDRWVPDNAIDGRYIWLPIRFEGEQPIIEWKHRWSY